jgi:hypothetical protein
MIDITTQHGTYPVHHHWLDSADSSVERWSRAGSPKVDKPGRRIGPNLIDFSLGSYRRVTPPGIDADGVRITA